ncbi:Mitochondrial protein import protein ZIM17 [Madurella mycetomatis]|uniref:Mitochondrial protein import protein ZIM17 n=1 Tax=Madurella mycetomatis TaxID=100816 RepID=A0A175WB26_9PEZI|nr:Mitochondrial protein import protein ZIM17 [Madurella mycetomatis]
MASKRVLSFSIPCIARASSPALSRGATAATAARGSLPRQSILQSQRRQQPPFIRLAHSIPRPRNPSQFQEQQQSASTSSSSTTPSDQQQQGQATPQTPSSSGESEAKKPNVRQQPHYELTFTCRPCGHRSRHVVSKQGYHHGSVLIACPGCRNRHVISDHLRIFGDKAMTVEDLLRERGELVKRGTLDEDLEFWEDGSVTEREVRAETGKEQGSDPGYTEGRERVDDDAPPGSSFKSVRPGGTKQE